METSTARIEMRINPETKRALGILAEMESMSMSFYIARILNRHVAARRNPENVDKQPV